MPVDRFIQPDELDHFVNKSDTAVDHGLRFVRQFILEAARFAHRLRNILGESMIQASLQLPLLFGEALLKFPLAFCISTLYNTLHF